jgi:ATP-dependent RNA circularization protein (DNA/RNA ligase family)
MLILNMQLVLFFDVGKALKEFTVVFEKNFSEVFKGFPDIRGQNQLYISNQHN